LFIKEKREEREEKRERREEREGKRAVSSFFPHLFIFLLSRYRIYLEKKRRILFVSSSASTTPATLKCRVYVADDQVLNAVSYSKSYS